MSLDFEVEKNKMLAGLYTGRYDEFEESVDNVLSKLENSDFSTLSEIDRKTLNQINLIFQKFRKIIGLNCNNKTDSAVRAIKKYIIDMVRYQVKNPVYVDYETWRETVGQGESALDVIFANVSSLQLSVGCSNFCRRCNEWALPGVRMHFTFDAAIELVTRIFQMGNNEFSLYSASDPLDWRHGTKTIADIIKVMKNRGYKCRFGLLTKIPKGSGRVLENLIAMDCDFALSVTNRNRNRIKRFENKSGTKFSVQHDTDDLLIPAGLDEDFITIKSSITDNYGIEITPEGASIIIPTFTSALHPTGQSRIPVTSKTGFFLKKKVGMDALPVEYFKPLDAVDLNGKSLLLYDLTDPQIENIMLDQGLYGGCTPPGMMNLEEYFMTFEKDAVSARKNAIQAVACRLKNEIFNQRSTEVNKHQPALFSCKQLYEYKTSRALLRQEFRDRLHAYIDFCIPDKVVEYKKFTFSFFLEAIINYISRHEYERDIILRLREKDRKRYSEYINQLSGDRFGFDEIIQIMEKDSGITGFDLFQMMMFRVIDDPCDKTINKFIKDNPAVYSHDTGRFTHC